ncbi:hypothetical protein BC834DRAFT_910211 [Gloeopeniophorella convolvens]|nr:hypothetical protein BC834DRAFT_910211 [Gloeopeniophorella convolvens]
MVQSFGLPQSIIPISSLRLISSHMERIKLGWIIVTQVCQRWRRVAVEEAKLWVEPVFSLGPKWVSEMTARAQGAPVEINFPDLDPKFEATESLYLETIRKHLSHIRTLKFPKYPQLSTTSTDLFDSPAPLLESFVMGRALQVLPGSRLFAGEAPNLRTISLCHISSPWASFPHTSLSKLKVVFPKAVPSSQERCLNDSTADLLTLLTHSPALEELVLNFCLPPSNHMKARPRSLQLPKLKKLEIAGEIDRVVQLLGLLDLPTDVSLSFHCISAQQSGSDSRRIFAVLAEHYKRTGAPVLRSLNVRLREPRKVVDDPLELMFSNRLPIAATSFLNVLEDLFSDSLPLELSCKFDSATPGTNDGLLEVLRQACSSLPLTAIEFVEIDEGYESADMHLPHECLELFKQFEQLTTIRRYGPCIAPVLPPSASITRPTGPAVNNKKNKEQESESEKEGRTLPSASIDNTSPPIIPFRNLTTLAIENADVLPLPLRTNETVQVLLSNAVISRIKCGLPISKLEIELSCSNFTWDGDEGALGDYDASEIYGYDDSDY